MNELATKACVPCRGGVPLLETAALSKLQDQLGNNWKVINWKVIHEHHLEKEFSFRNCRDALALTNKVGALAEAQGHHPDIHLIWGKVTITIWTHQVDGLTESDFILAAKIEKLQ